jgi:transcription elongation GreA/GreB family factor
MKEELLQELIERLQAELKGLESAAESHHSLATDQEFKAESKYDTRALEASYLASAEARRVEELKLDIQMLEEVDLKGSLEGGEVGIGSLVELLFGDQKRLYFLIPTSGGTLLQKDGQAILVVSVFSPIGSALLGVKVGEEFEVETPKENRIYKVLAAR